tara:strand:+ start:465 stop:683 length:219 start_codon:yes stop_codon:yes gene_type:complete
MKYFLFTFLFLLAFLINGNEGFALNDYEIRKICKKERKTTTCIKNLKEKKINLLKGNRIKIPVIPFKRNYNF